MINQGGAIMHANHSAWAKAWSEFLYPIPDVDTSQPGLLRIRQRGPRASLVAGACLGAVVLVTLAVTGTPLALVAAGFVLMGILGLVAAQMREVTYAIDDQMAEVEWRAFGQVSRREVHPLSLPPAMWSYAVRDQQAKTHYLTLFGLEGGKVLVVVLGDNWFAGRRIEDAIASLPAYQGRLLTFEAPAFLSRRPLSWKSGIYPATPGLTEPGPETMLVTPQRRRITENLGE